MERVPPSSNALRKVSQTVEQLVRALGVELILYRPDAPASGPPDDSKTLAPEQHAQREVAYTLMRIRPISHVASIGRATGDALVFAEDEASLNQAIHSAAGAILLPHRLADQLPAEFKLTGPAMLLSSRPRFDFARAGQLMHPVEPPTGIHSTASIAVGATYGSRLSIGPYVVIEKGAVIGSDCQIGAGAVIGAGAIIGSECHIYPRVVIYPGTQLGDRVVVHAGAVLGSDGFGYVRDEQTGVQVPFPQQGSLVIEDDVEIGANTTIDRGALEVTLIARGAKIDNLVHIGHNVQVGEHAVLAAQVGISGSSTIGAGAVLAGQVGIGDHAAVGEGVILGGQGGVLPHKTLKGSGELFWGTPAKPVRQYLRELASLSRLARRGREPAEDEAGEGK
jgi:UDP-3-O-[3-hydroxymyristoyl] glucosamine N-acyltransferase